MIPIKAATFALLASVASAACRKRCVVPSAGGDISDSPAIQKVFDECSKDSRIVFEKAVDYNVFWPIDAQKLDNVIIDVQGNLHLPQDIPTVQKIVAENGGSSLYWFMLKGKNVQWLGSEDIRYGWIHSYGQKWWQANPPGGTGIANRPHLMRFQATNGVMDHFKSSKPIGWNVSVKGSNITISNAIVDAVSEDWSFPFNTDGFGIGATDVLATDCVIYNGDDAFAISDGAHNVRVQRSTIGYETHGLSIGSLGSDMTKFYSVSNIHFDDITVAGGLYAARFKSWVGGQGLAENIQWTNIHTANVTFPVFITQVYGDQGKASTTRPNNSSVEMRNFRWENWTGSINSYNPGDGSCASDPCWYDVGLPDLKHNEAIIIACNEKDSCSDFELKNINLYAQDMSYPTVICMNAEADLNPKLGIDCSNGTFVPKY